MAKETAGWDWVGLPAGMSDTVAMGLEAVAAAGEDDIPRLKLADVFEECAGRPEHARLIRLQIANLNEDINVSRSRGSGVRLCGERYWGYHDPDSHNTPITPSRLLAAAPWMCSEWKRKINADELGGFIHVASQSNRNKSATIYPDVSWYRGFMHAVGYISPFELLRFVESGRHAWHPWDYGKSDSAAGEAWYETLEKFITTAYPFHQNPGIVRPGAGGGFEYRYYFAISRREVTKYGVRWVVGAPDDDSAPRHNNGGVIPEPIARFLSAARVTVPIGSGGIARVYYHHPETARNDVAAACRLFVAEAARQSRARVIKLGGYYG